MRQPKQITGYHFSGNRLRDGQLIPSIGQWLKHKGVITVCESGLHASKHPFDALTYAPGNNLHKVILFGELQPHGNPIDKYAGRKRKILASINAEKLLRDFARWSALQVIHLWNAPQVVKDYLETGDESLRDAARDASRDAVWAAARDASRRDAARRDAAWAVARDAAWAAARDAARDAARAAVWDAVWAASWAAAWAAALDAAFNKFTEKARRKFKSMVNQAFK